MSTKHISDLRVVATSAVVSISDVILNITVAVLTGSAVMLSQALQGLSDLVTGGILLLGVRRSQRQTDNNFQFGYGHEVFFWVLIAGIIMFAGTGGLSLYFGYQQIAHPTAIDNVWLALIMLVVGFSTNLYAFRLSLKRLRQRGRGQNTWRHIISSSIIETKATFVIDLLGTLAAIFGLIALIVYALTGNERFDGIGSVVIGLSMMAGSFMLMKDVRDLIVGKAVDIDTSRHIIAAAKSVDGVNDVLDLRTMYLGSDRLLAILEVHIRDGEDTDNVEKITDRVKENVRARVPTVELVQVEAETPE